MASGTRPLKEKLKIAAIAAIGALIVVLLIRNAVVNRDLTSHASSTSISVGAEAHLTSDTPVAFTSEALDALVRASTAHDLVGYKQIFLKGQAILVDANTRVLVIDGGFSTMKVRVIEGPFKDQAGWVNREFVSR